MLELCKARCVPLPRSSDVEPLRFLPLFCMAACMATCSCVHASALVEHGVIAALLGNHWNKFVLTFGTSLPYLLRVICDLPKCHHQSCKRKPFSRVSLSCACSCLALWLEIDALSFLPIAAHCFPCPRSMPMCCPVVNTNPGVGVKRLSHASLDRLSHACSSNGVGPHEIDRVASTCRNCGHQETANYINGNCCVCPCII